MTMLISAAMINLQSPTWEIILGDGTAFYHVKTYLEYYILLKSQKPSLHLTLIYEMKIYGEIKIYL